MSLAISQLDEPTPAREDQFCNGAFCQLVKNFQVPPERDLRRAFTDLLIAHGAQSVYGENAREGGIVIGTKEEVLSRTPSCPFCRFVAGAADTVENFLDHPGRDAKDVFIVQVSARSEDEFLWLRSISAKSRDGVPDGSLMLPGEQVVLLGRSDEAGSRTGRIVGGEPDYARMKRWLRLCDEDPLHIGVCTGGDIVKLSEARTALPSLRVVDVLDMRLVDIGWQERYVALSYVWGTANPPKLLRGHLAAYSVKGSLEAVLPTMPKTIQDMFTVVRELDLRYLWFDALCLVQDDLEDLHRGIRNMELVYESSYVTIITADSDSADAGIPGVGALPRNIKQDRQVLKPGLEIMRVHSVDRHLRQSKWNTRGWTLQEFYLSRRTITFVNSQAYFRCRQRTWYEDLRTDLEPKLPGRQDLDFLTSVRDTMDTGGNHVSSYTFLFEILAIYQGRDLTDENDALNAMAGILTRVGTAAKTKIVQGLPANILPLAMLLFHPKSRRAPRRRMAFPSWSWCGWTGVTSWYPFDKLDLMNAADEINDFNEDVELERAISRNWITYYTVCGAGQHEMMWTPASQRHLKMGDSGLEKFQALPEVAGMDMKLEEAHLDPTSDVVHQERRVRNYPLLAFQTLTAHFRLKTIPKGGNLEDYDLGAERPSFKDYKSRTYEICGIEDEDCGSLYADVRLLLKEDNVVKLVVLGECYRVEFPLEFDVDFEVDEEEEEPAFWVMMISLIVGIWERRGIGQISQSGLKYCYPPGPKWEQIELA
ncbi:hypothetical protein H2200_001858 [Cladophialophora chaetospira]|uniref:Heterokaryon incompatibility domain-containing protein n=1 Tax=Cladophialophora chaetospira TaxID=386627 RepID=A0AA38XLT3_9EURO|nr:hypothetical protein H2200_001858 [Cladophialophora chaetospira]